MENNIDCSKYNLFNLHERNEKFNSNRQFNVLFNILNNIEIYEKNDLEVLAFLKNKGLILNSKLTNKWKCYILDVEERKFWNNFLWLTMFLIFWLPFVLYYIWMFLSINWDYLAYFYFFIITFGILFLMYKNSDKRKKHMEDFKNKYFS